MRKSLLIPTLAALSLVAVAGVALAGASRTYIPQLGITVPDDKAAAVQHSLPPGGTESSARAPVVERELDRRLHVLGHDCDDRRRPDRSRRLERARRS